MQTETNNTVIFHDAYEALLSHTVDKLAQVKAQIAELRKQEEELKRILIDSGHAAVDSTMYRASIVEIQKEVIDWQEIALRFQPSRQLIRAHTRPSDPYFQVRVYSRKTSN